MTCDNDLDGKMTVTVAPLQKQEELISSGKILKHCKPGDLLEVALNKKIIMREREEALELYLNRQKNRIADQVIYVLAQAFPVKESTTGYEIIQEFMENKRS